jgi:hypothetical protein
VVFGLLDRIGVRGLDTAGLVAIPALFSDPFVEVCRRALVVLALSGVAGGMGDREAGREAGPADLVRCLGVPSIIGGVSELDVGAFTL